MLDDYAAGPGSLSRSDVLRRRQNPAVPLRIVVWNQTPASGYGVILVYY
jgi:hypothetical protein